MSGYFNNIKLPDSSGRPVDLGIRENLAATKMISDSFRSIGDRERSEFKEAEARRLRKLQEEREQFKFDREVNTDKAIIDFQNDIARVSAGGSMSQEQNNQLGEEYDRLIKEVGEEKAAIIINDKAQRLGSEDAKRAESDPYYRAELIKGVALPSGNIDPKNLIDLRNSQITRNETLGQRKEDLEIRAKEREEDLWFKKQQLAIAQRERNERAKEKEDARKALNEMYARSMTPDSNISPDGGRYNEKEVKTGGKTLPSNVSIPEDEGSEELSKMKALRDRIDELASKNKINYENKDEALKAFIKENPEAANSSAVGKAVSRGVDSAFEVINNDFGMPTKMVISGLNLGFNKAKQAFMSDPEREEYNKKLDETKAKQLQESLKSDSPGEKANAKNTSFDNYWKLKKDQQAIDDAELKKLQKELEDTGYKYYNNAANKHGVDEVQTIKTLMTPEEARNDAAIKTADALNKKGVAPEYVLKYAYESGEKAYNLQASLISNAVKEGKESAKNKNENRKETTKTINDEIKTLEKYKREIGGKKEKEIWYDTELLKISEVQRRVDEKISKLKKDLAEL